MDHSFAALIDALGWTLIHGLWQACLAALSLALVLALTPTRLARLRYLAAASSLAVLLVLFAVTFYRFYFASIPNNVTLMAMIPDQTRAGLSTYMPLIVALWTLGTALCSLRFAGGLMLTHRLVRRGGYGNPAWQQRLNWLARDLGIQRAITLLESAHVTIPMVIGHLKPVILLPLGSLTKLPADQLEALLLHELGHIRRHDYLCNLIQSLIEILYFHHPAVWWISAQMRKEREHCCDDLAVAVSGDPLTLAKALTQLQEVSMNVPKLAMAARGRKGPLLTRITRQFNRTAEQGSPFAGPTAATLILIGLFLISFSGWASPKAALWEEIPETPASPATAPTPVTEPTPVSSPEPLSAPTPVSSPEPVPVSSPKPVLHDEDDDKEELKRQHELEREREKLARHKEKLARQEEKLAREMEKKARHAEVLARKVAREEAAQQRKLQREAERLERREMEKVHRQNRELIAQERAEVEKERALFKKEREAHRAEAKIHREKAMLKRQQEKLAREVEAKERKHEREAKRESHKQIKEEKEKKKLKNKQKNKNKNKNKEEIRQEERKQAAERSTSERQVKNEGPFASRHATRRAYAGVDEASPYTNRQLSGGRNQGGIAPQPYRAAQARRTW